MAHTFPFPVGELSNDRILLTPFDLKVHGLDYLVGASPAPELFDYLPYGPFTELSHIEAFHHARIVSDPASFLFSIVTKTTTPNGPAGSFAGVIGLLFAQPENSACEIGYVTILPQFQRSYVNTNAVGLLLKYLLDTPDQTSGSLGLRRAVWQAHATNAKSVGAAVRLGWHREGTIRYQRVLPVGKKGDGVPAREGVEGRRSWGPARHTAMFSLCWDDWEGGRRASVQALMDR